MKKGFFALIGATAGTILGVGSTMIYKSKKENVDDTQKKVDKFRGYYNILNQWLLLKQEGKSIEKYFIDNKYQSIAIYGMGEMGNRLYDELKDSDIEIKYAVDQYATRVYTELKVLDKEDDLEAVDVMIVTSTFAFDEIEEELNQKVDFPIISLEDVIFDI